ncbi:MULTISPECIES: low molecular weight protein-tyrosine-phosphatase [Corallincola]|uniref:Low molecular weight phosphotyrosine protein phosphatase n=2 Tax=Corallincola TaxID=1775176 RepID=A0A368NRI7_9GAMM|nr:MULTISPECIES: low molecular weight protein-tyrosine-phosphatase [Corallincola]RCU52720.1 low molecular weight phosphotyrosine protein phosphatase [Corallincola holothuriorum]TAA48099.1 low molecular weight phosphotyrosine protein phosphatase [Corallincola spongiicola]
MVSKVQSVLFVCMGNICRSPTAEAVFKVKAEEAGFNIKSDSAGTIGYHQGTSPDPRAQAAGELRGYFFTGLKARKIVASDFQEFDLILVMDNQNMDDLAEICPPEYREKIKLMLSYGTSSLSEVPDPYYGGAKGFEVVLNLLEDACDGLIRSFK